MKYIKVFEAAKYKADKTGKIFKKPLYKKVADEMRCHLDFTGIDAKPLLLKLAEE